MLHHVFKWNLNLTVCSVLSVRSQEPECDTAKKYAPVLEPYVLIINNTWTLATFDLPGERLARHGEARHDPLIPSL